MNLDMHVHLVIKNSIIIAIVCTLWNKCFYDYDFIIGAMVEQESQSNVHSSLHTNKHGQSSSPGIMLCICITYIGYVSLVHKYTTVV